MRFENTLIFLAENFNKRTLLFLFLLFGKTAAHARHYYDERSYDVIGLPDGDEIVEALSEGLPLMAIGFLIAYFTMWKKKDEENKDSKVSNWGLFGILLIGVGFLMLIPLWAWVEAVAVSIVSVVFGIAAVIGIIALVYEKMKS